MTTRQISLDTFKTAARHWSEDKASTWAAAIAYSTVFAIAPLFIIVIAIAGRVLGYTGGAHPHTYVEQHLIARISEAAGPAAGATVKQMVDASYRGQASKGVLAQVIGWFTFAFAAVGLFAALQGALNTVWHVSPTDGDKPAWWRTVRDRLTSFGMVVAIGFFLLVTFAANAAIQFVSTHLQAALPFPGAGIVFAIVNWVVSLALITLLFALIFKVLPDADVAWGDVWTGAAVTSVLFVVGQALIGIYLGHAGVGSAYGAAGSLLALLLWVYYSAMVLLFGAEVTKVVQGERRPASATAPSGAAAGGAAATAAAAPSDPARASTVRAETVAPRTSPTRPRSTGRPLS